MFSAVGIVIYFSTVINKEVLNAVKTEAVEHMQEVSKGSVIAINNDVNAVKRTLKLFAEMVSKEHNYAVEKEVVKADIKSLYDNIDYISLNDLGYLDEDGILRHNVNAPQIIGMDFSFRNYYKKIKSKNDPNYMDVEFIQFKGVSKGDRGLIFAMGIFEKDGQSGSLIFKGVAVLTSTLNSLIEGYIKPFLGEHSGYLWFLESNGAILYHPKIFTGRTFQEIQKSTIFSDSFKDSVKNIIKEKKISGEYRENEGNFIYAVSSIKVGDHAWYIVSSKPEKDIFSHLEEYTKVHDLMITAIFIVIFLGFSLIFIFYIRNLKLSQVVNIKTYQLEYAKEVNEELDSIINTIAHDLKTPLTSVMGFTDLLVTSLKQKLEEGDKQYLSRIHFNANYMKDLIESLLEFARIGKAVSVIESISLNDIFKDVRVQLNYDIEKREAVINIPDNLPIVKTDKSKITRVFANLISNAIKFVPEDRTPQINVDFDEDDDFYNISVIDNGIGIEESELKNVFKLFHRLKEMDVSGTGVGLAIVKKIMEDTGGKIAVTSKKAQGATFIVSIKK
jgi:signal transduction histidine kinase